VSCFARDYRRIAEKFTRRNLTTLKTTSSNEVFLPFADGSKRELISEALNRLFRFSLARSYLQKINLAPRGS